MTDYIKIKMKKYDGIEADKLNRNANIDALMVLTVATI
jgi:hypothetical protein